jgi:hypothetical protein
MRSRQTNSTKLLQTPYLWTEIRAFRLSTKLGRTREDTFIGPQTMTSKEVFEVITRRTLWTK